ncbi:MAG: DUF805 domain-containing protein [Plesiomonas shigelloides]
MPISTWLFSFQGRLDRRGFWLGIAVCLLLLMLGTALLSAYQLLRDAWVLVLLWPLLAVISKRLHDRGKPAGFSALLLIPILFPGLAPHVTDPFWQWAIARFMPLFVLVVLVLDCGVFRGQPQANRFGDLPTAIRWRG